MKLRLISAAMLLPLALAGCSSGTAASTSTTTTTTTTPPIPNLQPYTDTTGAVATYTTAGSIDTTGVFFQSLGTNSRTCSSCHQPSQGMTITPTALQTLFASTPADPVFNAVDGANCPTVAAGNSTGRSLLLNSGLIRIALTLPTTAQFTVTVLNDPYGCATSLSTTGQQVVSVYRRPLPTASLPFLSNVMWDTRETLAALNLTSTLQANLTTDLTSQMSDAVSTHEQGATALTATQIAAINTFEQGLFTAQSTDTLAGSLSSGGALGGPTNLAATTYYPGINDIFNGNPTGAAFNPTAMTLYTAWAGSTNTQQASINRGQNLFNTAPITITNVPGLPGGGAAKASCTLCHNTPNIGNHSLPLPLDTGESHTATDTDPNIVAALGQLSTPSLPVYQITGCKTPTGTAITYVTTDPGKALTSGLCTDISLQKIPILRGLAARAPYFHNGSATTLAQVVNFYNARFQMGLTANQKTDLVNFLSAL